MKIFVRVKPRSRDERLEKTTEGYVAYISEQPIEGRANRALIELISNYFGLPKSDITILSGKKSKHKIVEIKDL